MAEEINNSQEEIQDEVVDTTTETSNNLDENQEQLENTDKQFSQEEVNDIVQKRLDREFKKFKDKLEKEKSEAEKLAKMSEEEKAKALLDKQKSEFEAERAIFLKEKLELETIKQLTEMKLPAKFSNFLVRETADDTKANLDAFAEMWNAEIKARIEAEVEDRLKGTTPKNSNGTPNTMSKKEFGLLPYSQKEQMMKDYPDLVNQILKS